MLKSMFIIYIIIFFKISSTASTLIFDESISVTSGSKKTNTNDFPTKITQPSIEKAMNYVTSMKGNLFKMY